MAKTSTPKISRALSCLALGLAFAASEPTAQTRNGMQVGPSAPSPSPAIAPLLGDYSIDFDEVSAPCSFQFALPLRNEYAARGVYFSGPTELGGGARMDECGNFGVTGHSFPNFMAFNRGTGMANGGIPDGPQTITFLPPVNSVTIQAGDEAAIFIAMECYDLEGNSLGVASFHSPTEELEPLTVTAPGIVRCELRFDSIAVFDDLTWEPGVAACVTLDFETEDDFGRVLVNGQHVDVEFGGLVTVTGDGLNAGVAIFDSALGGPNDPSQDPDLLVGTGNVLILQTENLPPDANDVFPRPNDDDDGGILAFQFAAFVQPTSVRLVDIDATDGGATVALLDDSLERRTYTVPANWTGDRTLGQPGQGTLDLTTLLPQPGFGSIATVTQDDGYDPAFVSRIEVRLDGSGAVDDLALCLVAEAQPRGATQVRNGSGVNPLTLTPGSRPVIGGSWVAYLDCSGHADGLALLAVRAAPLAGVPTAVGELLIGGPRYLAIAGTHAGGVRLFAQEIPGDATLAGLAAHAQGMCGGAPHARLSNALDIVLGF
jgi:hypothetical protein